MAFSGIKGTQTININLRTEFERWSLNAYNPSKVTVTLPYEFDEFKCYQILEQAGIPIHSMNAKIDDMKMVFTAVE